MHQHLFVYGTLQPGQERWGFLEPFVIDEGEPDAVGGTLHDTGCGYPAAVFDGSAIIHGRRYRLRPERLDEALAVLDEVESAVAGRYHRVKVTTSAGAEAWAYSYGDGLQLTAIVSGDWLAYLAGQ